MNKKIILLFFITLVFSSISCASYDALICQEQANNNVDQENDILSDVTILDTVNMVAKDIYPSYSLEGINFREAEAKYFVGIANYNDGVVNNSELSLDGKILERDVKLLKQRILRYKDNISDKSKKAEKWITPKVEPKIVSLFDGEKCSIFVYDNYYFDMLSDIPSLKIHHQYVIDASSNDTSIVGVINEQNIKCHGSNVIQIKGKDSGVATISVTDKNNKKIDIEVKVLAKVGNKPPTVETVIMPNDYLCANVGDMIILRIKQSKADENSLIASFRTLTSPFTDRPQYAKFVLIAPYNVDGDLLDYDWQVIGNNMGRLNSYLYLSEISVFNVYDENGDLLNYDWRVTDGNNNIIRFCDYTEGSIIFKAHDPGIYTAVLTVSDGSDTRTATASIKVINNK